ncbi:MAG: TIGR01620 family protein [Methylocystis sp.]|nr:TIGR01620 family protein [Methylocystis sp.]
MTEPQRRPRPRAFRLDGEQIVTPERAAGAQDDQRKRATSAIEPQADVFAPELGEAPRGLDEEERAVETAQRRGLLRHFVVSWGGLFWSALSGLVSLAAALWVTHVVEDLFARSALLGTLGLALAGAVMLALSVLLAREIGAMARQNRIAKLHIALAEARTNDDLKAARARLHELCRLYENRPETGRARALVLDFAKQIIDGRDLVDLAERNLVLPLDQQARREIAAASKRVSIVTTISPRALLDVLFVAAQAIRLMRRIAEIYGGRPGLLGFFKLARSVGAHLAITGGMAIGDSLLQQIVGHGIAAKLSARLGEGVLNGLLTARVGLSAMAVCRPMPFCAEKPPGVADVAPFLFGDKSKA